MLRHLIKKEILHNILSARFLAALVLLLVIVPFTTLVSSGHHRRQWQEYRQRQIATEEYARRSAHFNRTSPLLPGQPPTAMAPLFYKLHPDILFTDEIGEFHSDTLPAFFPLLDITFVVSVLLSLLALVFSCDAVSGEKEDGTLKLMLTAGVSRAKLLLAKLLGGIVTMMIPFLLSLATALLILFIRGDVQWGGREWAALFWILFGTVLYLMFFLGFGLFLSTRHHSSSAAAMTALFFWVILVLIVPSLSPYIASFLVQPPSRIQLQRQITRITDVERDELIERMAATRLAPVYARYPELRSRMDKAELQRRLEQDPAFRQAYTQHREESRRVIAEANRIQGEKAKKLSQDQAMAEDRQMMYSFFLSMLSPYADFHYLASDLASCGTGNLKHFFTSFKEWQRRFDEYQKKEIAAMERDQPGSDPWNTPRDMSGRPRLDYREQSLAERVKAALPPFTVLALAALLAWTAAFVSFLRYDPR